MGVGLRVKELGDLLRLLAHDRTMDLNGSYFLAHAALLRILREDPGLVQFPMTRRDLGAALDEVF
jgi:hypothetical protein